MSSPKIHATSLSSDQVESSSASNQVKSFTVPYPDASSSVPDPNEPVVWSCPFLSSFREATAACINRPTMAYMVASLIDRLAGYEDIARCYGSHEESLREEKHRGDRLEQELNLLREFGVQLRGYVKQSFDRLFSTFQDVRELNEERSKILSKQVDRLVRILYF